MSRMPVYTCNVHGGARTVERAKAAGFNAYHAGGICAIEIPAPNAEAAGIQAATFGHVSYVFE